MVLVILEVLVVGGPEHPLSPRPIPRPPTILLSKVESMRAWPTDDPSFSRHTYGCHPERFTPVRPQVRRRRPKRKVSIRVVPSFSKRRTTERSLSTWEHPNPQGCRHYSPYLTVPSRGTTDTTTVTTPNPHWWVIPVYRRVRLSTSG